MLIPVVLAGLLQLPPRARAGAGRDGAGGASSSAALSLLAFGLHIPDLSTQSRLVTSESVPNLIGLAVGAGGETEALHKVLTSRWCFGARVLLVACEPAPQAPAAPDGRAAITACGLGERGAARHAQLGAAVVRAVGAAAGRAVGSRWLRGAALALGVYLIIAWAPASGLLWNAIGFHPEKTSLGRLHQRYVRELLN